MEIDEGINSKLANMSSIQRIEWAFEFLGQRIVLSSSFGAQSAVMLHMATRIKADIPVILIDTGYLFAETYRFIDTLCEKLNLNLHVYRNDLTPAWQEARYGKLWEKGLSGIQRYNHMNKVEPMQKALDQLKADVWMVGLRRVQSEERKNMSFLSIQNGCYKLLPILEWTDKDIHHYLKAHHLPYHPLWDQGYVSIGDVHTTDPVSEFISVEQARFYGLARECGLHTQQSVNDGGWQPSISRNT